MLDDHDTEAELEEEIRAELDKISVSSLEIRDETLSEVEAESETDSEEEDLPESVLYCINVIKNRSKNAEKLVLQDLEDTDISSPSYGSVSNNPTDFMDELASKCHENALELNKRILYEIEKGLQINSTYDKIPNSAQLPNVCNLPVDEHLSSGDTDTISFGYYEVEERCRQSFAAWEDKQRELENQENEKLRAQKEREEKQLQEEEEKRYFRMKQFEVEKKKIEYLHKQEEDKINLELQQQQKLWEENLRKHEEFIKKLQLQMEEEKRDLEDMKAKERQRVADLQHNAAIKIQAMYRTFVAYRKYGHIIKERLEQNKRKVKEMLEKQKQEWKEMVDKIRQKDEERRKKIEEGLKRQEEIKKQRQKEHEKRQEEYEKKKNLLKLKKEQQTLMEEEKKREELMKKEKKKSENVMVKKDNKKREEQTKVSLVKKENKKQEGTSKEISVKKFTKKEDISINPSVEGEINEKEDIAKHLAPEDELEKIDTVEQEPIQKLMQRPLGESMSRQLIITGFNKELNENLAKLQKMDNILKEKKPNENLGEDFIKSQKTEFKENVTDHLELEQQREKGNVVDENKENECQEAREHERVQNNPEQYRSEQNQEEEDSEIIKEKRERNRESDEEEDNFSTPLNQNLSLRKAERDEGTVDSLSMMAPAKEESGSQAINCEGSSDATILTDGEATILNASDIVLNVESNVYKNNTVLSGPPFFAHPGDSDINTSVTEETTPVQSAQNETPCEQGTGNKITTGRSLSKMTISALVEEKRLAWMKTCRPWLEIFEENQRKKIVKRNKPRKCSVSKLPPLSTVAILQSGLCSTLQQVTTVTFQDLPGCSLSTLSECTSLQFLTLRRCGLTALEGVNDCKKLKYIDVQENQIQVINCENLENLSILLLNNNELTSFHGLDGCYNLQNIEVSKNKITRIGGLESLKSLQQLIVDHNQLMSTRGLSGVPTLTYLDCSYNNLTKVEGIKDCGLLQILKLQGNYLNELPSLVNQVLLRELYLDDNSISTLEVFSSYWLPLLQILTVSQNSLTEIVPLFQFVSLEKLDVSNNCLSDLTCVTKWFDACFNLCELSLIGNPLLQEKSWRHSILEVLPTLRILNGETLESDSPNEEINAPEPGSFSAFCQTQTQEFNLLVKKYVTEKRSILSLDAAEKFCYYFNELMKLSSVCRKAHEHGNFKITERDENLSIAKRDQSKVQQDHLKQETTNSLQQANLFITGVNENKKDFLEAPQKRIDPDINSTFISSPIYEHIEKMIKNQRVQRRRKGIRTTRIRTKNSTVSESSITSKIQKDFQPIQNDAKNKAATVIQSHWRGYLIRKQISRCTRKHMAAMIIQRAWRNYLLKTQHAMKKRKCSTIDMHKQREKAAILIQAVWKGFLLRKKLTRALASIKNEELEDDYGEINLDDFMFDEAALEKEWLSLDSTDFPSKTQALPNELNWPKYSGYSPSDDTSINLPCHPAEAWQYNERESPSSPEDTQFPGRAQSQKLSSPSDAKNFMKTSSRSKKEEKISEEWGFKDISTAQLVLKRAQKMKSKKSRHKLDPAVRLALFKNNGNKHPPVKLTKKAQHTRQGYFEADEDLTNEDVQLSNEKMERSKELTYQWLHTQVGSYETTNARNTKCQTHFLPVLDPDVLNGGRVQLVARLVRREDMDGDLVSMNSGSALAQNREKNNQAPRHSAESSLKEMAVQGIRNAKEKRISFRDHPLQFCGGWESGKRKAKTFN